MKTALLAAALALGFAGAAHAETASINGLNMYYEVHGEGDPIVLLHGAYMSIDSNWAGLIPTLAKDHQVIAVELQSHGHTSDRDTPITYEGMSDDVAALLDELKIDKAALFGFSMGGGVAIRFAIDHPEKVTRIVAASAGYKYDEETMGPDFMKMIDTITPEMFAGTPFETEYKRLTPHPALRATSGRGLRPRPVTRRGEESGASRSPLFLSPSGRGWIGRRPRRVRGGAYYDVGAPRIVSDTFGAVYSPVSPLHEHHFCTRCGCTTYGVSPDYSLEDTAVPERKKMAINVKILDDYELLQSLPVNVIDGRNLW
jgi:pimeloyl-ACP methyl ester carboxylesterase